MSRRRGVARQGCVVTLVCTKPVDHNVIFCDWSLFVCSHVARRLAIVADELGTRQHAT